MNAWWQAMERRMRAALVAGCAVLLLATAAAGWWLLREDQAVLFSELKPQDAAAMAAELERLKIGYTVAADGTTLLVATSQVHATRLKLMGRDLPLHGAVGLELFNHTDFGMTEFAQKINYQRALQGELTRTIQAFREVRDARVHLALPEPGLFRQANVRPTAAITLTLRPGQGLRPEQVQGIQRLVAAAVPGLLAHEVTLVDQHGVALTRPADGDESGAGAHRLDLKRELENYLSRKAGAVLAQALGPGQALASVDVTLNMDQVKVTTEDVIAAPDAKGGAAMGVLVRERESARDSATPETGGADRAARGSSMQRDVEYQVGRRVEQVVSQPGSVRRLQVVAVVRQPLDSRQQEQLKALVAAAVGAAAERGDTVQVQAFHGAAVGSQEAPALAAAPPVAAPRRNGMTLAALGTAAAVAALVALLLARRPRRERAAPLPLNDTQRRAALRRVESWLQEDAVTVPSMPLGREAAP
jgi:flagellar M-ring protein FliF